MEKNNKRSHPGKTLKYIIDHSDYKNTYFANRITFGIFRGRLLKIIEGKIPLSIRDCINLGNTTKYDWKYWLTQQRLYDEEQVEDK